MKNNHNVIYFSLNFSPLKGKAGQDRPYETPRRNFAIHMPILMNHLLMSPSIFPSDNSPTHQGLGHELEGGNTIYRE